MNHLIPWVEEALSLESVRECPGAPRIWKISGTYSANYVWLAVIGKLGLEDALTLSERIRGGTLEAIWTAVADELGISLENCDELSKANADGISAAKINERIAEGWTTNATHNIVLSPKGDEFDQRDHRSEGEGREY